MELESKVLSKQIQEYLYNYDGTQRSLGTAESCTGGRVAETIMSVPGSSNYYKGSVNCLLKRSKREYIRS